MLFVQTETHWMNPTLADVYGVLAAPLTVVTVPPLIEIVLATKVVLV
jgi:hypothetical protein